MQHEFLGRTTPEQDAALSVEIAKVRAGWVEDVPSDRGALPDEVCRKCLRTGGVYFVIDDSPFGRSQQQVVACDYCKNSWVAGGPLA